MGTQKIETWGKSKGSRVLQDSGRVYWDENIKLWLEERDYLSWYALCDENRQYKAGHGSALQNLDKVLCKRRDKDQSVSESQCVQGGGREARRYRRGF